VGVAGGHFSLPVFGEGGVGSASEASKKEPHPTLPEGGEGKNGTLPGCSARPMQEPR
jgi:hypothetical protein